MSSSYFRFASMVLTSTIVMLYLNTLEMQDVVFSETRVYMATVMGAAMAAIILVQVLVQGADCRASSR